MTIAFIGLGRIGRPIAQRLAHQHMTVRGYDISADSSSVNEFEESGGVFADSVADAVSGADVIITVLPDSEAVSALFADEAVQSSLGELTLWIDMTSGLPETTRHLARSLATHDVDFVDAAICRGGVGGASDGQLVLVAGGDAEPVERTKSILSSTFTELIHAGPVASGHTFKVLTNFVALGVTGLMAELFSIARSSGLDPREVADWLASANAGDLLNVPAFAQLVLDTPVDPPLFRLGLAAKDLRYLSHVVTSAKSFAPIAAGANQLYGATERNGGADEEFGAGVWRFLNET